MLCVFHYNMREHITLGSLKPTHPAPGLSRVKGSGYSEAKQSLPRRKAAKSLNKDRLLRDNEWL